MLWKLLKIGISEGIPSVATDVGAVEIVKNGTSEVIPFCYFCSLIKNGI